MGAGVENGCSLCKVLLCVGTWLRKMSFCIYMEYSPGKGIRSADCLHEIEHEGMLSRFKFLALAETWELHASPKEDLL